MGFKKGDHVFNLDVSKALEQLSIQVQKVLIAGMGSRSIHGAADRARRWKQLLKHLQEGMNHPAFALAVDKPKSTGGSDANSVLYGHAKQQMFYAFQQFLDSLRRWETEEGSAERATQLRMLKTTCLGLRLEFVRWIEQAVDLEAEAICKRESPESSKVIAEGRTYLNDLREKLITLLKAYTP